MKQSDQTQDKQYSKVKYIANVATLLKAWKVRQMNGGPTRRTISGLPFCVEFGSKCSGR